MLGVTLRWTRIPSRGDKNTPGRFILQKLGYYDYQLSKARLNLVSFNVKIVLLSRATDSVSSGNLSAYGVIHTSTGGGRLSLFKIWRAFVVGDARLLVLLPLETRYVALDNTVVLTF